MSLSNFKKPAVKTLGEKLEEGLSLHRKGRLPEAETIYREILKQSPHLFEAQHFLALVHMQKSEFYEALELLATAIEHHTGPPDKLRALVPTLGKLGHEFSGRFCKQEATIVYGILLNIAPDNLDCINEQCAALISLERYEEALKLAERGITIAPQDATVRAVHAHTKLALGRAQEAADSYKKALELGLDTDVIHKNLAGALQILGHYDEALQHLEKAIALNPQSADLVANRGVVHLTAGQFAKGWRDYQKRLDINAGATRRAYSQPQWDGKNVDGTLFIWGEQGIGDNILYASMLADLQMRARDVVLEVEQRLIPLFARSFPFLKLIPMKKRLYNGQIDAQDAIGNLGTYLRLDFGSFPCNEEGYLKADEERAASLRARFPQDGKKLIGISWRSKNQKYEREKSASLNDLLPFLRLQSCRFVDLQYGDTAEERAAFEKEHGIRIEHLDDIDNKNDIDGLAALIKACDAVVTVSNTTAHLAGALGKPVFVMLPYGLARFWYWFQDRADSPWYPKVRLYRTKEGAGWAALAEGLAPDLAAFTG